MSPATIHAAIEQYLAGYLTARNLAPLTRINYASDLKHLTRFLTEQLHLATIDQVKPRHLDGYLSTLDAKGLKGSSRRRQVATILSLFTFLVQQGILRESPAEELLPPEREREERRVLTEAEYKRLLSAVQHEVRDGAIIELLLQTGIRQSECAAITLEISNSLLG
jgi:site-specific recombinase XerD